MAEELPEPPQPGQALLVALMQEDTARNIRAAREELDRKAQEAAVAAYAGLKKAIVEGGVQLGKVYVVKWQGMDKAVRIIRDAERSRNARSDDTDHLKLEVMDMA